MKAPSLVPVNGSKHEAVLPQLLRARIIEVPLVIVHCDPCSCGAEVVTTDPNAAQALAQGKAINVPCPKCQKPLQLSLSPLLRV